MFSRVGETRISRGRLCLTLVLQDSGRSLVKFEWSCKVSMLLHPAKMLQHLVRLMQGEMLGVGCIWSTGMPWQRHQRPPLVAMKACASGMLLISPCKHTGKKKCLKIDQTPIHIALLSLYLSLILPWSHWFWTLCQTLDPQPWESVWSNLLEWKVLNKSWGKSASNMCLQCIVATAAPLRNEEEEEERPKLQIPLQKMLCNTGKMHKMFSNCRKNKRFLHV